MYICYINVNDVLDVGDGKIWYSRILLRPFDFVASDRDLCFNYFQECFQQAFNFPTVCFLLEAAPLCPFLNCRSGCHIISAVHSTSWNNQCQTIMVARLGEGRCCGWSKIKLSILHHSTEQSAL